MSTFSHNICSSWLGYDVLVGIVSLTSNFWYFSTLGQANKWVVNMERENGLLSVKQTDPNFLSVVEKALQGGKPLLIEGVGEELDPVLGKSTLQYRYLICELNIQCKFDVDINIQQFDNDSGNRI